MADKGHIKVGVFGASGYTGFETVKLLEKHHKAELVFATSESTAGQTLADIYPTSVETPLVSKDDAPLNKVDAVFCCLPHAASMPTVIEAHEAGVRVIDLSADFRLSNVDIYQKWYNIEHAAPALLSESVYGIPEINRDAVRETDLLANPGCYPTSVLLGLYPLLKAGLLDPAAPLISDSKSGVSGAGRKLSLKTHFVEANENLSPYSIGQNHRHVAEMTEKINQLNGPGDKLIFSPHLVPINRGMLSTIYVSLASDLTDEAAHSLYADCYKDEPFIQLLTAGRLASIAHTQNTNLCTISLTPINSRQFVICSSIDNLGKGAAGQAVQNFNVMFSLDETEGLL